MQEVLDTLAEASSYSPDKQVQVSGVPDLKDRATEAEPILSKDSQAADQQGALSADLYGDNAYSSAYPSDPYDPNSSSSSAEEAYREIYSQAYPTGYEEGYAQDGAVATQPSLDEDEAAAAAAHAAAWEAYYAANGYFQYYDENGAAVASWDNSTQESSTEVSSEAVVEAEEVVVEDAVAVEEVAAAEHTYEWPAPSGSEPVLQDATWQCGQCTYANSFGVAFCEVCCGHISLSPDAPADTQPPAEPTSLEYVDPGAPPDYESVTSKAISFDLPQPPVEQDVMSDLPPPPPPVATSPTLPLPLEPPLYVSIPCPAEPSSPLYSPSAPDFDCITLEDEPSALRSASPQALGETVKQLPVFTDFPDGVGKDTEVSPPVPTAQPSPSPPKIDYRALAFKRTTSMPSVVVSTALSPPKSPVRTATEFSF